MFECYDDNFFASEFHWDLFAETFAFDMGVVDQNKMKRVGWPMEYLESNLVPYNNMEKKNKILFPHRIAPEKQIEIFRDLADSMPQYEFVVCQEKQLTKNEYHNLLGEAKIVFSANLQETLGISWYEGALVGAIPMVPDRLSYSEMALDEFKYPDVWTKDYQTYQLNKKQVMDKIVDYMENYKKYVVPMQQQVHKLQKEFFSGKALYESIKNG
jgi:hypothetical protein